MRKFLAALLLLAGAGSSGCIIAEDSDHPRHHHCFGCGHVYVKGTWR
jgi:hypothetical protein